jgi:predicted metal-dependent hydrolase
MAYSTFSQRVLQTDMPKLYKKQEFKKRVLDWARRLDIEVKSLSIRPMRNKWASCSTAGNLNFNSELLELDQRLADCVVVHELLHLSVPNHGKLWKSLMRAHIGDYEELERRLPTRDRKLCN